MIHSLLDRVSRKRVATFTLILLTAMIIDWILYQNGLQVNASFWIALVGITTLAFAFVLIQSKLIPRLQTSPSATSSRGINPPLIGSAREPDHTPSRLTSNRLNAATAPLPQIALQTWIEVPFISESQRHEVLSAMSEVIIVLDSDGRYLQIAPMNPSFLFRPSDGLIGRTLREVLPQTQADFFLSQIHHALETHTRVTFEYRSTVGQNEIWFAAFVSPLTEHSVLWVARDITLCRNAENRLSESEERFRSLVEKSSDVISILDASGAAFYRSPSAGRVTGYSNTEHAAKGLFDLVHAEDLARAHKLFETVRESPLNSVTTELRVLHKSGSWRWLQVTATNHLTDPSIRGIVVNYHDITGAKAHTEEILRSRRDLNVLFQIGQSLSRLASLFETLENVFAAIGQALDSRNLYIALYDEAKQEIHFPIYTLDGERRAPLGRALRNGITEYILRTKSPLFLLHQVDDELIARGIDRIGRPARSFLGVPMVAGGNIIGVIAVQDYENEDAFTAHDLELLSTIACQVGSAIENARLYDQAQNRAKVFQTLHQTTQTLALGNDLPKLLQVVAENATELLDAAVGGIILYDEVRNVLEFSALVGLPIPIGTTMGLNEGLAGQVFQSRQALSIDDYTEWEHCSPQFAKLDVRAMIGVPMIYRGKAIGVLQLGEIGDSTRKFTDSDQRLLALFAAQIAGAVHNARLLAETQQRADEFAALYEITNDLSALHELSHLLQVIVDRAAGLLSTTGGGLYLYDPERNDVWVAVAKGLDVQIGTRLELGEGMAGKVAQSRQPLFVDDYRNWEGRSTKFESVPFTAVIEVPMLYGGELIGVLTVHSNTETTRRFTEQDVRLLSLFASHAAGAVRTARLLAETQKHAAESTGLLETTRLISTANQDLVSILQIVVEQTTKMLNTKTSSIYLYDPVHQELELRFRKEFPGQIGTRLKVGEGLAGRVAASREPMAVDDYSHWEGHASIYAGIEFSAAACAPMLHRGELIGVLSVAEIGNKTRKFLTPDLRLLSLLAAQAADAVHDARLLAETRKRAQQVGILNEITNAAASTMTLREMLQTLANRVGELFGADGAYITLWDEERKLTISTAGYGPRLDDYPQQAPQQSLQTMTQSVLEAMHTLVAEDVFDSPNISPSMSARHPARSLMGLPLIAGGKKLGAVMIEFNQSHHFTPEEIAFGEHTARQIAVAVAKALLLEESQQRAREFETLHQVTRDLNSYKELPELLQTILDRATELFRTPSGTITLYDSVNERSRIAAVREFPIPVGTTADLGKGLAGIVSKKREPMIIPNYSVWESRMPESDGIPFNATMCVPMINRGELIGTLAVLVRNDPARKFSEADARLLSLFASQAANAVYEARLFDETKTRADQMALLYDAGLTLNRVLDPKHQLEFLLKLAVQTLKADRAIFYRYDQAERTLGAETAVGYDAALLGEIYTRRCPPQNATGIPDWVIEHRLAVNLGNVTCDPRYSCVDPQIQSGLWVPIEHENHARGVLSVFSTRSNAFNSQDERLLALYANQLSISMGNAELFGNIKQRLGELEAIQKLSTTLRAARSRDDMLPLFLDQTLALFETDTGMIWLHNSGTDLMDPATTTGWFKEIHEKSVRPGEGIAGHVFVTGKLHLSREFKSDPIVRASTLGQIPAGWGGACVPIRSAERIVGVLFVAVQLPRQLNEPEARLLTTLAEIAGNTIHRMHLHESLQNTFVETVAALAHAIDARDAYTAGHSNNVSHLAVELAAEVGLSNDEREVIRLAGLLHDIGKIAIPDAILHKPGRLTPEEYALFKTHPKVGAQILESIQQLKPVVPIVLGHQEHFDGTGYPNGLAREEIPIGARVLSVVDAYSAMIDQRAYRPPRSKAQALEELERWSGRQFDPEIVQAFQKLVARKN